MFAYAHRVLAVVLAGGLFAWAAPWHTCSCCLMCPQSAVADSAQTGCCCDSASTGEGCCHAPQSPESPTAPEGPKAPCCRCVPDSDPFLHSTDGQTAPIGPNPFAALATFDHAVPSAGDARAADRERALAHSSPPLYLALCRWLN